MRCDEGKRAWEVWTPPIARRLENLWGDPHHQKGRHYNLVHQVVELIEGPSVLDVGCGLGHLYAQIKDRNLNYRGIDISEPMLEKARKHFPNEARRFQKGDIYHLNRFHNFHTVVALSVLIHLPEVEEPINQLWNTTLKHCIFSVRLGAEIKNEKIKGYGGKPDKYQIIHTETNEHLFQIFSHLRGLKQLERYIYDSMSVIFKLTRGK